MTMLSQYAIKIGTKGRSLINITARLSALVKEAHVQLGLCQVFLQHTSASIILCENADPDVRYDLETFMQRLVPDDKSLYQHIAEGIDDMPAHIRTVLTQNSLTIPVTNGALNLGAWQGVFLWEHRFAAHERNLVVTILGQ
jgi:secondary thiamine-phosphate synthase enzyme